MVKEIVAEEFESEVLGADVPVLVDFWAEWCSPCRMMGPVFKELSTEIGSQMKFFKLNVETERQVAALLSDDKKKPAKTVHKKGRDVIRIEESLSDTLGAEVKLASETREKGRIVIRYSSLDQLDGLLEKLGYTS